MRPEVRPPARVVVGQVVGRDPEAVLDGGRTPVDRVDGSAVCQCAVPVEMWIDEIKQVLIGNGRKATRPSRLLY